MTKRLYLNLFTFSLLIFLFPGCEKNPAEISLASDYKVAAILDGVGDLTLINPDGTDQTIVAQGLVDQVAWSPVSAQLVYAIRSPSIINHSDLYLLNVNTKKRQLLSNEEGFKNKPLFSPDGSKIVFFNTNFSDNKRDLSLVNSNGSNKEILFKEPSHEYWMHVGWSNISDHFLIYKENRDDSSSIGKIYLLNVLDKTFEYLIDSSHPFLFSIDGNQWVYHNSRQGNNAIYILDLSQKTNEEIFSNSQYGFSGVRWHPDGSRIVFAMKDSLGISSEIYQLDIDGTNLTQLTYRENENCVDPQYFPDGKRLIYQSRNILVGKSDLYILDLAGDETINMTQGSLTMSQGSYWAAVSLVRL